MSRKIDFDGATWGAHRLDAWLQWAGSPDFPDHLRVAFVAFGRHRANGHALLDREELTFYLVRRDGILPDRRTVNRAIRKAVDLGLLNVSSSALCLVVNAHDVQGGEGDPNTRCRRNHTSRGRGTTTSRVVVPARTTTSPVVVPARTTTSLVVVPRSAPSLFYTPETSASAPPSNTDKQEAS